jgi:hypothetical protein
MGDEWLYDIIERWNEFSWLDRKLIWWRCTKRKHSKHIISLAALVSILGVLMWENHQQHMIGLLSLTVLFYFYTMFIDYLLNRGKTA